MVTLKEGKFMADVEKFFAMEEDELFAMMVFFKFLSSSKMACNKKVFGFATLLAEND